MRLKVRRLGAIAFLFCGSLAAQADTPGISAHHGRVYETAKAGLSTQAFLEIDNSSPLPDMLTGVACPVAGSSLIVGANGKPVSELPVAAGQHLMLSPAGPHILLQATHFSIDHGGAIPCSLSFRGSGEILVYFYATLAP
jgi:copper(I)-binding protein